VKATAEDRLLVASLSGDEGAHEDRLPVDQQQPADLCLVGRAGGGEPLQAGDERLGLGESLGDGLVQSLGDGADDGSSGHRRDTADRGVSGPLGLEPAATRACQRTAGPG
jgi:hypothetical protein